MGEKSQAVFSIPCRRRIMKDWAVAGINDDDVGCRLCQNYSATIGIIAPHVFPLLMVITTVNGCGLVSY